MLATLFFVQGSVVGSPLRSRSHLECRRTSAHQADHGGDGEQDDRDKEHELRGFHRGPGDSTEPEEGRHEGDDEKCYGPTEHLTLPFRKIWCSIGCDLIASITSRFRRGSGTFALDSLRRQGGG